MKRRALGILMLIGAVCGCRGHGGGAAASSRVRLGYFPNLTHAAALVGIRHGDFARRLSPATVETKPFNTGPEAMEALFAGALDAAYVGPGPALNGWLRSNGQALVIVAGAASGGAAFVVAKDSGIVDGASLHGKRVATPQLGNTQDVALRAWLAERGFKSREQGGDIQVMPMANPDILTLFRSGKLDGAWVPEPWVSRLVEEAGARVFIDERSLWAGGRFPTTLLVVTRRMATERPEQVRALVAAHVDAVRWGRSHPDELRALVDDALFEVAHQRLPAKVLADALSHVELTWDPMPEALAKVAGDARRIGYVQSALDVQAAVDRHFLDEVVGQERGP